MLFLLKIAAEVDKVQRNICVEFASQPAVHEIRRVAEIIFTVLLRSSMYSRELERNVQEYQSIREKRVNELELLSLESQMLCTNVIVETIMFFNNYTLEWEELQSMQQLRTGCQLYCFEPLQSEQEIVSANMRHQHKMKTLNNNILQEVNNAGTDNVNADSQDNCKTHGLELYIIPQVEFHVDWTKSVHRRLLQERVCATLPQQRSSAWRWLYVFEPSDDANEVQTNNDEENHYNNCTKANSDKANTRSGSKEERREVLQRDKNVADIVNYTNTKKEKEEVLLSRSVNSLAEFIINTIRTNVQLSHPHGFSEKMYIAFVTIAKKHNKLVNLQTLHNFSRLVQSKWRKLSLRQKRQQQHHRLIRQHEINNFNKSKLLDELYSRIDNSFHLESVLEELYQVNFDQLIYSMQGAEASDVGQVSYSAWTVFALQHPSVMELLYWLSLMVNYERNAMQLIRLQVNKNNASKSVSVNKAFIKQSEVEQVHVQIADNDVKEGKNHYSATIIGNDKVNSIKRMQKSNCNHHHENVDYMLDNATQGNVNFTPHQQRCAACREMAMMQLMWINAAEHGQL